MAAVGDLDGDSDLKITAFNRRNGGDAGDPGPSSSWVWQAALSAMATMLATGLGAVAGGNEVGVGDAATTDGRPL